MLSRHAPARERGPHDLDERRRDHRVARLTRRMQRLGYRVYREPVQTAERFIFNGVRSDSPSHRVLRLCTATRSETIVHNGRPITIGVRAPSFVREGTPLAQFFEGGEGVTTL
jgi:hypothetical protein